MEIKVEPITTVTYTIVLTEAEAKVALSDPADLKAQLRMALGVPVVQSAAVREAPNGHKPARKVKAGRKQARPGKAARAAKPRSLLAIALGKGIECPYCHAPMESKRHLGQHKRRCPKSPQISPTDDALAAIAAK